jgi:SPP1 family predicted phage head-tail adaptor
MSDQIWSEEVTLIGTEGFTEDELGQQIPVETETTVCCAQKPTPRSERYLAGQSGIQISETLIVHPYEYSGENIVIFNGRRLRVLKTYKISMEELELTCTERLGDRNDKSSTGDTP